MWSAIFFTRVSILYCCYPIVALIHMQHAFISNVLSKNVLYALFICLPDRRVLLFLVPVVEPAAIEAQLEIGPTALADVDWQPDDVA